MDIYGYWRSAASYRVRAALALKGLSAHEIPVNLDAGEQNEAAYRAVNPQGGLPSLVEDGLPPLTQSLAILEYLEERYPEPALLPRDLRGRARVRSLAAGIAADSHPLIVPRVRRYLQEQEGFDAARWKAWQTQWFGEGLRVLEARVAGDPATGAFCHGDTPGFADLCLMSCLMGVRVFKLEVGPMPTLDRIAASCRALDAFQRAEPERQLGAP